ncbi:helix-turn-helix domain-containing protein [Ureibacillus sp. FSL W7-1570]|uniref:IclR family transcriptional regulator n=1 Tax=Ureibacillus suwonensis TaxID=313007 RepID=A0ABW0RC32_9BACL
MSKENKIQSLEIGLNILEIIATHNKPLKFSEIQNITSMTKSNLHKYLTTLHEFGAIQRNPDNTYSLGHKLIQLGNLAQGQTSIVEVVIPYLKKISEKTGLTALLAVPSVGGPLVSYISDALYGINIGAQIGTNLPLHSSTGVIFASFHNELVKKWLDSEMEKLNEAQLKELQKEFETARKTYFVSKIEPLVTHVSSFSVPILNFEKELLGAITIVGYTQTIPTSSDHPVSRYIINISKEISSQYGFSESVSSE